MQITNEQLNSTEINKTFTIELNETTDINIYKFGSDDNHAPVQTDEWDFVDYTDREIFDSLSEDQQEELTEFINNIKLF